MSIVAPWRSLLRQNFTSLSQLADFLELSADQRDRLSPKQPFSLNLPRRLAEKIEKGRLDDALLRQFVPLQEEEAKATGFCQNPVGDHESRKKERLLIKYQHRALLVVTSACAMHCRYCFRRHFDYAQGPSLCEEELELIQSDPTLREVILSGGDPLSLSNEKLGDLLTRLSAIPSIERIRFHSRFLVGIPERLDEELISILKEVRPQLVFVLHVNHPRELDSDVQSAVKRLGSLGITLLNQSVLLKGVNDNVETLKELSEKLASVGCIPYYLHQLDRVEGAHHFEVEEKVGLELIKQLTASLSGYMVPRYVREIAGEASKTQLHSF